MSVEILEKKFDYLKEVFKQPRLALSCYFSDLRNQVDLACIKKTNSLETDADKKIVNKNWSAIINRINSFEEECLNRQVDNEFDVDVAQRARDSIQLIESKLNDYRQSQAVVAKNEEEKEENEEKQTDTDSESDSGSESENDENDNEAFNMLADLIYDALFELQKILFLNKTMFFLLFRKDSYYRTYSENYQNNFRQQFPNASTHRTVNIFKKMNEATCVGKLIVILNGYCGPHGTSLFNR